MKVLICILIIFHAALAYAGGMGFSAYSEKSIDNNFPGFRFLLKMPDGKMAGWDETKNEWIGEIKEKKIYKQPFSFPLPDQECTSENESVRMELDSFGSYVIHNGLYCKNVITGETVFISSAYDFAANNIPDGNYRLSVSATKSILIDFCLDFIMPEHGSTNDNCLNKDFTKKLIMDAFSNQEIEFVYNKKDYSGNWLIKKNLDGALVSEWQGCYELGLIKNKGVYNSIAQKLSKAGEKQTSGDLKTASNIYNAALNEIEAQSGKGIDPTCADILMEDIKSLISE